jgi:hypothetical protein
MLKNLVKNSFWIAIAFCCATQMAYAQGVDPTPRNPFTGSALINIAPDANGNLTIGGEYKQAKNVVLPEKPVCWNWYADIGYVSEYNFRGTNLTPDADGAGFITVDISKWGFTVGLFGIHQFGTARAPSFSMGEGGGSVASFETQPLSPIQSYSAETVQNQLDELDAILQYSHDFGPITLTAGNIAFFIQRDAQTFVKVTDTLPGDEVLLGRYGPFPTVGDEQFDRLYFRLSTNKIPHIEPWITYYQTIYSEGQDNDFYGPAPHIPPNGFRVFYGKHDNYNFHERNDRLGGYLEGRIRGNFPIGKWIDFNPFGVISASFHDRTEPIDNPKLLNKHGFIFQSFREIIRGRSLSGWNVAQVGLEVPIHLLQFVGYSSGPCAPPDVHLDLVPNFTYSYHISEPTAGTDRNEVFGGAKFAITF